MSHYGPKAKQRGFDELVLSESWFQFADGRVLALRRMKIDASPGVYSALDRAVAEAGDPKKIDALIGLAKIFCCSPRPSWYIRLRRLLGIGDFSERTLRKRIIPLADRQEFEKWLIEENRDIDLDEYKNTRLAEVKKNVENVLLTGFATEMARIKAMTETFPPEISAKLRSFFSRDHSAALEGPLASSLTRSDG